MSITYSMEPGIDNVGGMFVRISFSDKTIKGSRHYQPVIVRMEPNETKEDLIKRAIVKAREWIKVFEDQSAEEVKFRNEFEDLRKKVEREMNAVREA